jgi:hypothetical protein
MASGTVKPGQIHSTQTITVDQVCDVRTMDHLIQMDESEGIDTFDIKLLNWGGTVHTYSTTRKRQPSERSSRISGKFKMVRLTPVSCPNALSKFLPLENTGQSFH